MSGMNNDNYNRGRNGRRPVKPPINMNRAKKDRKRKKYNIIFNLINGGSCLLIMFGTGLYLAFVPRAEGFLPSENRNLAELPEFSLDSYFSGEYTDKLTYYYTDTIPGREELRSAAKGFTNMFGVHSDGVEIIGNASKGGLGGDMEEFPDAAEAKETQVSVFIPTVSSETDPPETQAPEEDIATEDTSVPVITTAKTIDMETPIETKPRSQIPDEGEIVNDAVIITGRGTPEVRAMSMFGGYASTGKNYAEVLNQYKKMVGKNVNVYNMSIPLSSAFYCPANLKESFTDQHACIRNIANNLDGVINIDVFDVLGAHSDEYIYFRTDHHWEPLGAYYAAQEFCRIASVPFSELSDLEKRTKEEKFCGTMYSYSNYLADLKTYPDTFTYYKPKNEYTTRYYTDAFTDPQKSDLIYEWAEGVNMYSMFLGGDKNITEVTTDVHNGRTLVLIKNSFGNALVPFFVGSFEKIYVVDFRYVQIPLQDLFERVGATDILFGMAISSCYNQGHIDSIQEIMSR